MQTVKLKKERLDKTDNLSSITELIAESALIT